jgi:hypothetical protein
MKSRELIDQVVNGTDPKVVAKKLTEAKPTIGVRVTCEFTIRVFDTSLDEWRYKKALALSLKQQAESGGWDLYDEDGEVIGGVDKVKVS